MRPDPNAQAVESGSAWCHSTQPALRFLLSRTVSAIAQPTNRDAFARSPIPGTRYRTACAAYGSHTPSLLRPPFVWQVRRKWKPPHATARGSTSVADRRRGGGRRGGGDRRGRGRERCRARVGG